MTDVINEDAPILDEPLIIAPAEADAEIAFVVPALAYDSIDTDEELVQSNEPKPAPVVPIVSAPPPTVDLSETNRSIEGLSQKIAALQTLFERELRAESTREKVVDRLHAELQEYKQDLLLSVMRPVFVDLIQLHDDVGKTIGTLSENDQSARIISLFEGIQQGIEDILYRQGVEPFAHGESAFDAKRQRAVSTVATDNPTLARTVASRHRKGFVSGEKIIRPEVVSVYVFKPAADEVK